MYGFRFMRLLVAGSALIVAISPGKATAGPIVVIGAEDDAAPWSYADGTGYVNDVVKAAFERAGWTVHMKVMPYARCKAMVLTGALAACFSASKTSDLDGKLLYPRHPVFEAQNILVAPMRSALPGCDTRQWASRPTIGTVRGYEYIVGVNAMFEHDHAIRENSDSEVSNLRKLEAGRLDAALITVDAVKRLEIVAQLAHVGGGYKTVCNFGSEPAYVAFSSRHPQGQAALEAYEQGFGRLQSDGSILALQKLWRSRLVDSIRAKQH
jgi:polar amino acid transport system substrate-binding protein